MAYKARTDSNFNPRTREGCDTCTVCGEEESEISIHAPARGATAGHRGPGHGKKISIHAPARGATSPSSSASSLSSDFNPRTREGCDLSVLFRFFDLFGFQSTHPRGVRLTAGSRLRTRHGHFNPRTREGCDARCTRLSTTQWYFNPRTREGCDLFPTAVILDLVEISIHAPARGATGVDVAGDPRDTDFNPRTREGCDQGGGLQNT